MHQVDEASQSLRALQRMEAARLGRLWSLWGVRGSGVEAHRLGKPHEVPSHPQELVILRVTQGLGGLGLCRGLGIWGFRL